MLLYHGWPSTQPGTCTQPCPIVHTAVPPIVHTAVPRENNEHGCVYLRCRAVCKLPGCVEGHPCVSWSPSELIRLWLQSGDFFNHGAIWWKWSNLGFPGICRRIHWGNGLKFCMLTYRDHRQNWLSDGYSLLIFLIWALFWLGSNLRFPVILVMLWIWLKLVIGAN